MHQDNDVRNLAASLIDTPMTALRRAFGVDRNGAINDRLLAGSELLLSYASLLDMQGRRIDTLVVDGGEVLSFVARHKPTALDDETLGALHEAFNLWLARVAGVAVPLDYQRGAFRRHVRAVFEVAAGAMPSAKVAA
jgi:fermentation-respiration switch protein FrsA (DUF1100 family)